jgi:glyoxylase-like metal-dependent hydrolase (beta-lactamase superfamily II)
MPHEIKHWQFGDVRVTRIEESAGLGFQCDQLLPDWTSEAVAEHLHWLVPGYFDPASGRSVTSIHTWLVKTPSHTVLIDTCVGNHKERPWVPRFHQLDTPWLDRLSRAGVTPDDVDFVLCTHLHTDHVGWNTFLKDGRWVPTFPNARYVFSQDEHDHWSPETNPGLAISRPDRAAIYTDSVLPVVLSKQALILNGSHAIDDWLSIEPAPGHTPGHIVIRLKDNSRRTRALFTGDIMHHPIQVVKPMWNSCFCDLPEQARTTRSRVLETCVEEGALLMPAHFADPHVGRIERSGDGFRLVLGSCR